VFAFELAADVDNAGGIDLDIEASYFCFL